MRQKISIKIEENKRFYGNTYDRRYLDYICVEENGKIVYPDHMTKQFKKLLQEHHLKPIRLHDLRHSCASDLLASGVSMKEIQEWLGHANFSTTADVYSHLDFSAKITAANRITAAYAERTEKTQLQEEDFSVFEKAMKEMSELGIGTLEDYLKYKKSGMDHNGNKEPFQM